MQERRKDTVNRKKFLNLHRLYLHIPVNEKTESHIREKEKMLGTLRQNYESAEIEFVIR